MTMGEEHLRLRIQTLEASNKRLRKHLKEARHHNQFPHSSSLTNCLSQQLLTPRANLEESNINVNDILQKGMQYIIDRYEHDIRSIISYAQGKIKINNIFPFASESPKLFEELANKVYRLKVDRGPVKGKGIYTTSLNKLIVDYNQAVLDNQKKCRLILHLEEVIQRLHFQTSVDENNNKVIKCMASSLAVSIHSSFKLSPLSKLRAVVNMMRFSFRLSKSYKKASEKTGVSNLRLVEAPSLYRQLYKSYTNNFQYTQNQATIKRLLCKDPEKSLTKLLNLNVFYQRNPIRSIEMKERSTGKLIRYCQVLSKNEETVARLQKQMISIQKQHQEVRSQYANKLEEYKERVKTLTRKIDTLRAKLKKTSK